MPGTNFKATPRGTRISVDANSFVITAAETNQISTVSGKVGSVVVWGSDAGTSATLDIYDHASSNSNQKWHWGTTDGKGIYPLQMPMQNGIRVVTGGTLPTSGGFTIQWD